MDENSLLASLAGFLDRLPADIWAPDHFWALVNRFIPEWWIAKALMQGVCVVCLFLFTREVGKSVFVARLLCAIGGAMIFVTLFNPGLGPFGDLVFTAGFMVWCIIRAKNGIAERREIRSAKLAAGVLPVSPERTLGLALTGRLYGHKLSL